MTLAAGVATLLFLLGGDGGASLAPSPFSLSVEPSSVRRGERVVIRVQAHPATGPRERFDLYLVSILSPTARYLTPAGTWSDEPVALGRGLEPAGLAPIVLEWPEAGPPGWLLLGLVAVPAGHHPLDREVWLHRPAQAWVMVRHARGTVEGAERLTLVGVILLTLALGTVATVYPRTR